MISGFTLSQEIGRRSVRGAHPFVEALTFGLPRAASFGAAGWLARDSQFGINFGVLSAIGFVVSYLLVDPPLADIICGHPLPGNH